MQDLSDFVFISMANLTLVRRDGNLDHLKPGIKHDTLGDLRITPLHLPSLFQTQLYMRQKKRFQYEDRHYLGPN